MKKLQKKIFPIISILILLSLLGLIFFQFLWLKSAKEVKEQQLIDNINRATNEAAEKLGIGRNTMTRKISELHLENP